MWQYVQVIGAKGRAVAGKFKETAIADMKQAEELAERLLVSEWNFNLTTRSQSKSIFGG